MGGLDALQLLRCLMFGLYQTHFISEQARFVNELNLTCPDRVGCGLLLRRVVRLLGSRGPRTLLGLPRGPRADGSQHRPAVIA